MRTAADAIVNRIRGRLFGISGAIVLPFLPPAVQGLGQFGGFAYERAGPGQPYAGRTGERNSGSAPQGHARKDLTGLYSTYTANDPAIRGHHRSRKSQEPARAACSRSQILWASTWVLRTSTISISTTGPIGCMCRPTSNSAPTAERYQAVLCALRQCVDDSAG